jgi:threonine/homoserine/homoserine lactone efflux protein
MIRCGINNLSQLIFDFKNRRFCLSYRSKQWFSAANRTSLFNRVFGGIFIAMGVGLLQLNHKN